MNQRNQKISAKINNGAGATCKAAKQYQRNQQHLA